MRMLVVDCEFVMIKCGSKWFCFYMSDLISIWLWSIGWSTSIPCWWPSRWTS